MPAHLPHRDDFEIAIICALKVEGDAVEALMTKTFPGLGKATHDDNFYITGTLADKLVVLTSPRGAGILNTAITTRDLKKSFERIKLALVVGVAGGAPRTPDGVEILLGDVIISTQVVQYDFGSWYARGLKRKQGTRDIFGRAPTELGNFLSFLQRADGVRGLQQRTNSFITDEALKDICDYPGHGNDHLFRSDYPHRHRGSNVTCICNKCLTAQDPVCSEAEDLRCVDLGCDLNESKPRMRISRPDQPSDVLHGLSQQQLLVRGQGGATGVQRGPPLPATVHFGVIACSSQVLKDSAVRDRLCRDVSAIGFEMEGAGCWESVPTIVVKSVCDYADSHKSKRWQSYASVVAACCARAIVEEWQTTGTLVAAVGKGQYLCDRESHAEVLFHVTKFEASSIAQILTFAGPKLPTSLALTGYSEVFFARRFEQVLQGLFVSDPAHDLYAVTQRIRRGLGYTRDTCNWLQENESFVKWSNQQAPQLLSLIGSPGIGKTTLSTNVVQRWREVSCPQTKLAYYFCDANIETRRTGLSLVKSLLRQILVQVESLSHRLPTNESPVSSPDLQCISAGLVQDFVARGPSIFTDLSLLSHRLTETLRHPLLGDTWVLIDGLDECEETSRWDLFYLFSGFCRPEMSAIRTQVKILLTYRPGKFPTLINLSPDTIAAVVIDEEPEVANDVFKFIETEIRELSCAMSWPRETAKAVEELLGSKSEGTFLWVSIALQRLWGARADTVLEQLAEFPAGLDAMYVQILRGIKMRDRARAAKALHYVVAGVPNLTLTTFATLLACDEMSKSGGHLPSISRIRDLESAWKACETILQLYGKEKILRTIHQSVNDFFRRKVLPEDLVVFTMDEGQVRMELQSCCNSYLNCIEFNNIATDVAALVGDSHASPHDAWNSLKEPQHVAFLRYARDIVVKTQRPPRSYIDCTPRLSSHSPLVPRLERQIFWQNVWQIAQKATGDRFLHEEQGLLYFVDKFRNELTDIALSRLHLGMVRVLEATRRGWWVDVFRDNRHARLSAKDPTQSPDYTGDQTLLQVLLKAALSENIAFLKRLVVFARSGSGLRDTLALLAAELSSRKHVREARRLVEVVRPLDRGVKRFLHRLAAANACDAVQHCVDCEDEVAFRDSHGRTPLHCAAGAGSIECVQILSKAQPHVLSMVDYIGKTPLHHAATKGCARTVRYLIQAKAKIRAKLPRVSSGHEVTIGDNPGYNTELHCAVSSGSLDCVELLMEACPAMVNHKGDSGRQPLHLAAVYGYWDIMQYLVTVAGASCSTKDNFGATPVHYAVQSCNMETFTLMFPPHIIALVIKRDTCTPRLLARAAMTGSMELVKLCLQKGARVHETDSEHRTALHYASQHQWESIVDILLAFDQPPQAIYIKDLDGCLPLHHAAVNANLKIVTSLTAADKTGESLFVRHLGADLPLDLANGFRRGVRVATVNPEVINVLRNAEREFWMVKCDGKSRVETIVAPHKHLRLDTNVRSRSTPADDMDDVAAGYAFLEDGAYLLDSLEESDDEDSFVSDDSAT